MCWVVLHHIKHYIEGLSNYLQVQNPEKRDYITRLTIVMPVIT